MAGKNYKETMNLPRTAFPMKADLVNREPEQQRRWAETDLYGRILAARRDRPRYVLHDGPPYANGGVHIGTGLNKILKDLAVKYQAMRGRLAPYVPGWDCHGLPIEHKVMEELGPKALDLSRLEIRAQCRRLAERFIDEQREQFRSLGVLGSWDRPYLTFDPGYEAAVLDVLATLVDGGYIYRTQRPIHWCLNHQTALAEAEIEYDRHESPSIYVRFPLEQSLGTLVPAAADLPAAVVIWTTTPWTLPANRATALSPSAAYALVKAPLADGEACLVMAADRVEAVRAAVGGRDWQVLGTAGGQQLEGLSYRHPLLDRSCPLVLAEYVRLDEGTGCVHTAPGHGLEDFLTGQKYQLETASPVDEQGRFTDAAGAWAGQSVFAANRPIVERLRAIGLLLHDESLLHSYPHCWRCKQPVIFRATEQWFLRIDHAGLRQRLLDATEGVRWVPDWGQTRFQSMVRERPDWCLSRQRAWGVPIPAFYCAGCGQSLLTGDTVRHVASIFAREGADAWFQREAGELLPPGTRCPGCSGAEFKKENDILDVWFESGASHRAVLEERPELEAPCDLYLEGTDQHRGWFQVSLITAVASGRPAPFRAVVTHGFVVDEKGEKVSKSKGTLLEVEKLVKELGADILRLWISSVNFRDDIPVSREIIAAAGEPYQKLRRTFRYMLGLLPDFTPAQAVPLAERREIDRWLLSRLQQLVGEVTAAFEDFQYHKAIHLVHNFCTVELSAFYLDVLKDLLYAAEADSPDRRSAQTTVLAVLDTLARLVAPILVHTAEEVWAHLPETAGRPESVHLAPWPEPGRRDEELEGRWQRLMTVRYDVARVLERARAAKEIGSSMQARVVLAAAEPELKAFLESFGPQLAETLIVAAVSLEEDGEGLEPGQELPALKIKVERTAWPKCARCWNYREAVGEDGDHLDLCPRCVRAVARA